MAQRIKLWWELLIGGILSLLGFSGCNSVKNIIYPPAEYGMPNATYKLAGDVSDTKGKPVKGIRVIFEPEGVPDSWDNDTLYTDAKGRFQLDRTKYIFGAIDSNITFLAEDVDGEENGSFKSNAAVGNGPITVTQTKKGDGKWYNGEFEINTHITLENKEN